MAQKEYNSWEGLGQEIRMLILESEGASWHEALRWFSGKEGSSWHEQRGMI